MAINGSLRVGVVILASVFVVATTGATEWRMIAESAHDLRLSDEAGALSIETTGKDPYLLGLLVGQVGPKDRILEFEYFCPDGVRDFSIYWGPPISERTHVPLPELKKAEGWRTYRVDLHTRIDSAKDLKITKLRFDFGRLPGVQLRLRNVTLRPMNENERRELLQQEQRRIAKIKQAKEIQDYLQADYGVEPTVVIDHDNIAITMPLPTDHDGKIELLEYKPTDNLYDSLPTVVAQANRGQRELRYSLPRFVDGRDRSYSAWRLRNDKHYLSARVFPQSLRDDKDTNVSRLKPANQKGLTCLSRRGPLSDLTELGVTAVTLNVPLTRLIAVQASPMTSEIPGTAFFFRDDVLRSFDPLVDFCRQNQIVVSAIVLIPSGARNTSRGVLIHPECDGGTYAMPNLESAESVRVYTHILERLAKRFSSPNQYPGVISNWIAHNEIDFHTVWTNMGKQPRELVTETYYRSMRLIHQATSRHNPNARVFASLTHHWVVPDDGKWDQLSPRELLQALQAYSQKEGDFDWGVAYHPYPQSLFASVAWRDQKATGNLNTPLITMQNIEVLGEFLAQESMRSKSGNIRPVLLSEQGYHSHGYGAQSQDNQAASLAYAMDRVRECEWIESFIYHRWIDHPGEGGLMLGLRTLPTTEHRYGRRKKSWHVYQAVGTSAENANRSGLPGPE